MQTSTEHLAFSALRMIERQSRPRTSGLTYVRDRGMGCRALEDTLEASADYIDIWKLAGFGPRLQTDDLIRRKIELCRSRGIDVSLGGAMLEIALLQGPEVVRNFLQQASEIGISVIEVCRQVVILPLDHLLRLIDVVRSYGLKPLAEVGVAYGITAEEEIFVDETRLISTMKRCLDAGAWMLLLESEGLTESRVKEQYRWDVISKVANSFDSSQVMFEADDPEVWNRYIRDYGPDVNLFVDASQVLILEASRRGGWAQPQTVINRVATFYE